MNRKPKVDWYQVNVNINDGLETYHGSISASAENIDEAKEKIRMLLDGGHSYQIVGATLMMLRRGK